MKKEIEILIIGAGAAGLMAALELAKSGKMVKVVEAQSRPGGRIHSIADLTTNVVEAGAEFIHGNLPLTTKLLREGNIPYHSVTGAFWQVKNGIFKQEEEMIEGWNEMIEKLKTLQSDMTVQHFLDLHFSDPKYTGLKKSVTKFVEGYDLADVNKASIGALKDEWMKEDESEDFRIEGGYVQLVNYLVTACKRYKVSFEYNTVIKYIGWTEQNAKAISNKGKEFNAKKILVTVPLGILCQDSGKTAGIIFNPPIHEKLKAARNIGYGSVIKIILDFKNPFWKEIKMGTKEEVNLNNLGFLFSDERVPTWWTQYPTDTSMLTGWLGGRDAYAFNNTGNKEILKLALQSLSNIFKIDTKKLEDELSNSFIYNWTTEPFSCGAYSYPTLETERAKQVLNKPEKNILFFAGEALNEGKEFGTVEAALSSGLLTAKKILSLS